ncbi:MAG: hypothetical protein KC613_20090 [Myxococcales bacterium]|nr:hypothetical protein [Myxococcales bacterium]MCB9521792.1 hypothetical protein [Myxococcales bacterium]
MIRRLLALLLAWPLTASGQPEVDVAPVEVGADPADAPEAAPTPEVPLAPTAADVDAVHAPDRRLEAWRTRFDALTERALGRTAKRVRYDWRKDWIQAGLNGGLPAELNNYNSLRAGAFVRVPIQDLLLAFELHYVFVSADESADKIALTPYRQPGRPDRFELDVGVSLPLAEGIVTAVPDFMPATQLVLSAQFDFRYLIYPGAYAGLDFLETLRALVDNEFSDQELQNIDDQRLPGMAIDRARYHLLTGLGLDLYFQSGLFISPRMLIHLPLTSATKLYLGLELDVAVGMSF